MATEYQPSVPGFSFGGGSNTSGLEYRPSVAPVNFSEMSRINRKIGRINAENSMYEAILKRQAEERKVAEAAFKASLEEAAGQATAAQQASAATDTPVAGQKTSEEDSPGILGKIADAGLNAVQFTFDVLTTPTRIEANIANEVAKQNVEDRPKGFDASLLGGGTVLPTALIPDSLDDVKADLKLFPKAAWQGVPFDAKVQSFQAAYKTSNQQLPVDKQNQPLYKASALVGGITFDILADPLTYVGFGAPKQGIEAVGRAKNASRLLNASRDPADQAMIDKIVSLGIQRDHVNADTGEITSYVMGHREVENMLGDAVGFAHSKVTPGLTDADRAAKMRDSVENHLLAVREAVQSASDEHFVEKTDALKAIDEQLVKLAADKSDLALDVEKFTGEVYREEMARAKAAGKLPEYPTGTKATFDEVEELSHGKLFKMVGALKNVRNGFEKVKNQEIFDEAGGHWIKNKDLVDEGRVNTEIEAALDKHWPKVKTRINDLSRDREVLKSQQKDDTQALKNVAKGSKEEAKIIARMDARTAKIADITKNIASNHAEHIREATVQVAHRLGQHISAKRLAAGHDAEYNQLKNELEHIDNQIHDIEVGTLNRTAAPGSEGQVSEDKWLAQLDEEGNFLFNPEYTDATKELMDRRKIVQKAMNDRAEAFHKENSFKSHETVLKKGDEGFQEELTRRIENDVEARYKVLLQQENKARTVGALLDKVWKATLGKGLDHASPVVQVGNKKLTYAEFLKLPKAELEKLVTQEDHIEAASRTAEFQKFMKNKKKAGLNEAFSARYSKTTQNKLFTAAAKYQELFGGHVTPESMAFQRIFKRQMGDKLGEPNLSLQRYAEIVAGAQNQRTIGQVPFGKEDLNIAQYIRRRTENPEALIRADDDIKDVAKLREMAKNEPEKYKKYLTTMFHRKLERVYGSATTAAQTASHAENAVEPISNARRLELRSLARDQVTKKYENTKELSVKQTVEHNLQLTTPVEKMVLTAQEQADRLKIVEMDRMANAVAAAKAQFKLDKNAAKLKQTLEEIKKVNAQRVKILHESAVEAKRAKKVFMDRVDEQVLLNVITNTVSPQRRILRLSTVGGRFLDIPSPQVFSRLVEKAMGFSFIKKSREVWAKAFVAGSRLPDEMKLARHRFVSNTPGIIKYHLDDLKDKFLKFKPAERRDSLAHILGGGAPRDELDTNMLAWWDNFAKYYKDYPVGDEFLEYGDINHFLPNKFHVKPFKDEAHPMIDNGVDILEHMPNLRETEDPMEVMWKMSTAMEMAQAWKALRYDVKVMFGVKRFGEQAETVEKLRTIHKWETVKDLGDDYLFPRDVKDDIEHLFNMLRPERLPEVMKYYDKALGFWKSAVTVWNIPGFYMRNGIGEFIMGTFDNVFNPRHYKAAQRMVMYKHPDAVKESLKTLTPWKTYQTKAQQGAGALVHMRNGKTLSVDEALILFHDQGLHTGFVSTSWDTHAPGFSSTVRAKLGLTKINEMMRHRSEQFEDFWRYAHFVSRMERSRHADPLLAAQEAAKYVRKYHFDYTDFTPTEKMIFCRIIPFYKWNRKSMPLMASMLFTKPGRMTMYPKAMQNVSYAYGGADPLNDPNGFMPDYDLGEVVPGWIRDMQAYPIGPMGGQDNNYFNLSTPQFDAMKGFSHPGNFIMNSLTPAIKAPIELSTGRHVFMDPDWKIKPGDIGKLDYMESMLPQSKPIKNLINKVKKSKANPGEYFDKDTMLDPNFLSWLTGGGFYANTPDRQKAETVFGSGGTG